MVTQIRTIIASVYVFRRVGRLALAAFLCAILSLIVVPGPECLAQSYYSKVFDLGASERIKKFVVVNDTVYASTGQRCGDVDCTTLISFDLEGNLLSQRLFAWLDGGDHDYIISSGSDIVLSGHSGWNEYARNLIQVCNTELDSIMSSSYSTESVFRRLSNLSVIDYEDWYVLTGFLRPLDDDDLWPGLIIWMDKNTLSTDTAMHINLGSSSTVFEEAVIDSYGYLNIYYHSLSDGEIGRRRGVLKFDSSKEIVSSWQAPFQNTTQIHENLLLLADGGYVIAEYNVANYELIFLDQNGNYLNKFEFATSPYEQKTPFELIRARNGDILGCGLYESNDFDTLGCCLGTGYIFRMSPEGEMIWERIFVDFDSLGNFKYSSFTDIEELPDGSLLLGGNIREELIPGSNTDMWLVRTDSLGCIYSDCGEVQIITATIEPKGAPDILNTISIAPNPVVDRLLVRVSQTSSQALVIRIFDSTGKVVINSLIDGTTGLHHIDVSVIPSGLYYFSVSDNGRIISTAKFLRQF